MQIIPDNQGLLRSKYLPFVSTLQFFGNEMGKKPRRNISYFSDIFPPNLAIGHDGEQEIKGSISTTETATSEETRLIRSTALCRLLSCI